VYHRVSAVQAFKASIGRPQHSVLKISVNGTPALWRPYTSSGGNAFVSAATNGVLVSVEAEGEAQATDTVAKTAMGIALNSFRSQRR
jgi:hypothetical protein